MYLFALWQRLSGRLLPEWKIVTRDEARSNPYFGFGGWLLIIYLGTAYGVVSPVADWILGSYQSGMDLSYYQLSADIHFGGNLDTLWRLTVFQAMLALPFLVLAPVKHALTPKVWIAGIWIGFAAWFAVIDMPGQVNTKIVNVVFGLVWGVLMTWYILASKRVNVTYLNRVPTNQPKPTTQSLMQKRLQRADRWAKIFYFFIAAFVGLILLGLFLSI